MVLFRCFYAKKLICENKTLNYFLKFVTRRVLQFVTVNEKGKNNKMIYLMLVDTPEEKRKFVILYEKYRYLVIRVALDVLRDRYLAEE